MAKVVLAWVLPHEKAHTIERWQRSPSMLTKLVAKRMLIPPNASTHPVPNTHSASRIVVR